MSKEIQHLGAILSRSATPHHRKKSAESVLTSYQDALWVPLFRDFSSTSSFEKILRHAHNSLKVPFFFFVSVYTLKFHKIKWFGSPPCLLHTPISDKQKLVSDCLNFYKVFYVLLIEGFSGISHWATKKILKGQNIPSFPWMYRCIEGFKCLLNKCSHLLY